MCLNADININPENRESLAIQPLSHIFRYYFRFRAAFHSHSLFFLFLFSVAMTFAIHFINLVSHSKFVFFFASVNCVWHGSNMRGMFRKHLMRRTKWTIGIHLKHQMGGFNRRCQNTEKAVANPSIYTYSHIHIEKERETIQSATKRKRTAT